MLEQREARQGDPALRIPGFWAPLLRPGLPLTPHSSSPDEAGTTRPEWGGSTSCLDARGKCSLALPLPLVTERCLWRAGHSSDGALTRETGGSRSSSAAAGWDSPPGTPSASCRRPRARARGPARVPAWASGPAWTPGPERTGARAPLWQGSCSDCSWWRRRGCWRLNHSASLLGGTPEPADPGIGAPSLAWSQPSGPPSRRLWHHHLEP